MSGPGSVYRSTDERVVGAWENWLAARDARTTALVVFANRYQPPFDAKPQYTGRGRRFAGFCWQGPRSERPDAPDGWRWDSRTDQMVPDRRTNRGKDIAAEADDLPGTGNEVDLPGMPCTAFDVTTSHFYHPGIFAHDGTVWVSWGCAPDVVESSDWSRRSFDRSFGWENVDRLSTYYIAREAFMEVA